MFLPLSVTSCQFIQQTDTKIKIEKVIDGDTFKANNVTYRLLGVDTPETFDSKNNFQPTKGIQYFYGSWAKAFTTNLLLNNYVTINTHKKDKYQRPIAKVTLDNNKDLGIELVKNGLAIVRFISANKNNPFFYHDLNYIDQLNNAQSDAQKQRNGFWYEPKYNIKKIFP